MNLDTTDTQLIKTVYGWEVITMIPISLRDRSNTFLKVTTMKRSNGKIMSYATVVEVEGLFTKTTMFLDYSSPIGNMHNLRRATKGAVEEHHKYTLDMYLENCYAEVIACNGNYIPRI